MLIFSLALFILSRKLLVAESIEVDTKPKELPDCSSVNVDQHLHPKPHRNLIIVSTLDGKISALDPNENGNVVWSQSTGPGKLLSSSLSKLEMRSRGQWVRLIPSLDGSLYKFNGETVEPLPFTADFLLQSSFRLGDDLVITGGKETRTYGLNVQTGEVHYICTMNGCNHTDDKDLTHEDILVIKRSTQTVRAIEPRTGKEKWNFIVGEHQLSYLESLTSSCNKEPETDTCTEDCMAESINIQVIVPEGIVGASNLEASSDFRWSVKFPSPVVDAWEFKDGNLLALDLFDGHRLASVGSQEAENAMKPVLYVGIHDKQLYVQHSPRLKAEISSLVTQVAGANDLAPPRVEWKPYIASAPSRTPIINTGHSAPPLIEHSKMDASSSALVLRNDLLDYPYDIGYYLFETVELDNTSASTVCLEGAEEDPEAQSFDQYIIVSLWFWWKEVLAISILTSVLVNVLITRHVLKRLKMKLIRESSSSTEIQIVQQPVSTNSENSSEPLALTQTSSELPAGTNQDYSSRYSTDFELIRCLGQGGFGMVFESRNKIDDWSYAVKRICLPNSQEARDKVMREVKALAKLDHVGIVRYYNAWLECPPAGWQERQDKLWRETCSTSPSVCSSVDKMSSFQVRENSTPSPVHNNNNKGIGKLNPLQPFELSSGFVSSHVGDFTMNLEKNDSFVFSENDTFSGSFCVNSIDKQFSECTSGDDHSFSDGITVKSLPFQMYQQKEDTDSFVKFEDINSNNEIISPPKNVEDLPDEKGDSKKQRSERPDSLSLICQQQPEKLYLYIQMQLCKKESLKDWLSFNAERRDYDVVVDIFYQITNAVDYVHENGLIHRDLKPSNIFFSMDGCIKIGDFGLATAMSRGGLASVTPNEKGSVSAHSSSDRLTDCVGTQLYMSPEQISGLKYDHKVDIFSMGLIFFELLFPFSTQMERVKVLMDVKRQKFPDKFKNNYPQEFGLMKQLLCHDASQRPSTSSIKQHHMFKEFQQDTEALRSRVRRRRTISKTLSSSSSD